MFKRFVYLGFSIILIMPVALAFDFNPDFSQMKTLRCDFTETIYDQNNSVVTENNRYKIFRLNDNEKRIYLQKEPIDRITYYENDKIKFNLQSLTDDFIEMSQTTIDRTDLTYTSTATMTYDNPIFGTRSSKSIGTCKVLN